MNADFFRRLTRTFAATISGFFICENQREIYLLPQTNFFLAFF